MANVARFPTALAEADNMTFFDHWRFFTTVHNGWTSLVADVGTTAAVGDAANGILALGTAATDNNEAMVRTTQELFLVAAGKPLWGCSYIQYTEANTDDANVFVGFASAAGADLLVDNGAGPRTTGNLMGIYKVDGETLWRCVQRNGTDVTITQSNTTAGGSAYQLLEIEVAELSTTQLVVTYYVSSGPNARVRLKDVDGKDIEHRTNITSATEMNFVAGYVKAGGANAETLNIDYSAYGIVI